MNILRSMRDWPEVLVDLFTSQKDVDASLSEDDALGDAGERTASPTDIAFAYILFHGREAESTAIIHERANQTAPEMVNGFVDSHEFRTLMSRLAGNRDNIMPAFRERPSQDLRLWAVHRFELAGRARRKALGGRSLLHV